MPSQNSLISPVKNGKIRNNDKWGKGHYGASRGNRTHNGLDIIAQPKQVIVSPVDGIIKRKAHPYANDLRYTGLLIEGSEKHKGYSIKIFYMTPLNGIIGKIVKAGEIIGEAQDLANKYPGITNHIHIEVRYKNQYKNPSKLINPASLGSPQ